MENISAAIPNWGFQTLQDLDVSNAQEGKRLRGSNRQYVRFYKKKILQPTTTEARIDAKTGNSTPIKIELRESEREYVNIITPGDKNTFDGVAENGHKQEHWKEYNNYRSGTGIPLGTPIEDCSYISRGIALELKYLNVHTQEQLADASDHLCTLVPTGWELREYARQYCKVGEENKVSGAVTSLKAELQRSQAVIEQLMQQQKDMQATILDMKGEPISVVNVEPWPEENLTPGQAAIRKRLAKAKSDEK